MVQTQTLQTLQLPLWEEDVEVGNHQKALQLVGLAEEARMMVLVVLVLLVKVTQEVMET
jgi:hypothetical protein